MLFQYPIDKALIKSLLAGTYLSELSHDVLSNQIDGNLIFPSPRHNDISVHLIATTNTGEKTK